MTSSIRVTLAVLLSSATSIALAQPATGIDLSNLTPKTPSQKAAAEANANTTAGAQSPNQKSTSAPASGPFAPGTASSPSATGTTAAKDAKATSLLKSPFGSNAKPTPAAADDPSSSGNDVQVKIPKK